MIPGIISIVFICLLICAAAIYWAKCRKKILAINNELEGILKWLAAPHGFQDIDAEFKNYKRLASAWRNFEKSLTKTKIAAYSTTEAAEFFSPQNLTRGMNMGFWQSYGGIFTGLGILGTFVGLIFGLSGVDITSSDIEVLKRGIENLLLGVETAFLTSLFGIGAALIYSGWHHKLLTTFHKNVQALADTLDETFPRRSAEEWLGKNYAAFQEQTTTLQIISEQSETGNAWLEKNHAESQNQTAALQNIGEQITAAIHNALDKKLTEQTNKICAAIDQLGAGGTEAIDKIFADKVGGQLDRFSAALNNFTTKTETILADAQDVSKTVNEQLLTTLNKLDEVLSQQIETSTEVADRIKTQQADAAKDFEKLVQDSLDNFNKVMGQIMVDARTNADNTARQAEQTSEQFLSTLTRLSEALQEIIDKFKQHQENSAGNFEAVMNFLLEDLKDFATGQKELLEDAANTNAAQISEGVKAFNEIVNRHNDTAQKTFDQIQTFLSDTEKLLEIMDEASISFKKAADPVKQSTQQLAQNLTETAAQMKTLTTANQLTCENITDLSTKLDRFVDSFNGIANELERSASTIQISLANYNSNMEDGLTKSFSEFDKGITQAVGQLRGLVEDLSYLVGDLNNTLENFNKNRR